MGKLIITLNSGSSSIKFAVFEPDPHGALSAVYRGGFDGLGLHPALKIKDHEGATVEARDWQPDALPGHNAALMHLIQWLDDLYEDSAVAAVGHRIVHGGPSFSAPMVLDDRALKLLTEFEPLAPLHQPYNLEGVRAAQEAFPESLQVGCFDTAFHRTHPWVNDTFALPRSYYEEGIRRYGFHGLSYEYISKYLSDHAPFYASGRVIACHLGNGASMCAIRDGQSIGSTMGFSALDGLPMGTRCGQIDPGVVLYLIGEKGYSVEDLQTLLYRESGLKGLSGITSDMRDLEQSRDPAAREALDYFVFRIRRELGAMAAILGGVDALVFAGGIGENSNYVRARVCSGFEWLGLELDETANRQSAPIISSQRSRCRAFIVNTDEELMIARHAHGLLG